MKNKKGERKRRIKNELLVDVWCDRGIKLNMEEGLFGEKKDAFDFRLVEFEVKMECLSRNILESCEDQTLFQRSELDMWIWVSLV